MSANVGPCPCECNSGGFCGGCGHAGCGRRVKADCRDWDVVAVVGLVHPEVCVRLTGTDGNAFAVMGAVTRALARAGVEKAERDAFLAEAMSGDNDHLLQTAMRWVTVS